MTKRKFCCVAAIALATATCSAFALAYVYRDRVNASTHAMLEKGMPHADVVRLMGPCDSVRFVHYTEASSEASEDGAIPTDSRTTLVRIWSGKTGTLMVEFEAPVERVVATRYSGNDESIYRTLSRAVGLEHLTHPPPPYPVFAIPY